MRRPSSTFLAIATSLLGLLLIYFTVGDTTWWGECFAIWPPGGWCVLLLPRLGVLSWRRRHAEALATLLMMATFLGATVEWRSLFRLAEPEEAARFDEARRLGLENAVRVVTWNVAGARPLADLEELRPDLCLLQESAAGGMKLDGQWRDYRYSSSLDPATLSRYPIRALETRKIGPWTEPQVLRLDFPSGRRLVVVNVRLVLPSLVVAVANLEGPRGFLEAHEDRKAQFPRLRDLLVETMSRERTDLGLLCGDFNTPGGSRSLQPLADALRDVWPISGTGWGATMTADFPMSRIDQCWVTPSMRPIHAEVRRGNSDHRMLVVDLLLPD